MAEQLPQGGGQFPWGALLQNASPWTFAVLLGYLLWDTIKRQAKATEMIATLTLFVQEKLGDALHDLDEVRRTQESCSHCLQELTKIGDKLESRVTEEVRRCLSLYLHSDYRELSDRGQEE